MRFLAILMFVVLLPVSSVIAEDKPSLFAKFKDFILDEPLDKPHLNPARTPSNTSIKSMKCIDVLAYDHTPHHGLYWTSCAAYGE